VTPISLIGGSAVVFSSILNHPSSTLTPVSLMYMLLLSFHYAIQPRLAKRYIKASSRSVALAEEITKTAIAASLFVIQPREQIAADLQSWTIRSSLTIAAVPAIIYAVQGVLQYQSHQHLDAVTFNGLTQTKTLSAAFWCYILLGRPQSPLQLLALGILCGSALLFQGKVTKPTEDRFMLGVVPCVAATLLSGLAGALSQKGLQIAGGKGRGAYFYAMEVSMYSALTLLVTQRDWGGFFRNWDRNTLIPIVSKAAGGVLTVLVHKYTGSVSKGFSLMFGLVLAGMLQSSLTQKPLPLEQVVGTVLVIFSGWLHFTTGY
jgi:UDP-sugar transporter A1/2/3